MLNISNQPIKSDSHLQDLYSLRSLRTPKRARALARLLALFLFIFIITLFLPWQQNIRGIGNVTALDPANRPQMIEAVIGGRVKKWNVREGDYVNAGDTIATLTEVKEKYFDPQLINRLKQQIVAKQNSLSSKKSKASALQRQIDAMREAMRLKVEQSDAKLNAEKVKFQNAENQYQRNKKLYEAGNIPLTKFQDVEYKFQGSQAEYLNAKIELDRVRSEYMDKISKAQSDLNSTQGEAFETEAEIAKAQNELANTEIRAAQYEVVSPQSGYVVKAMKAGIGETIKEGDAVCTIMPDTKDVAVEMYVRAMDVPLISKGRKVRIQFDGWPAIQFSGWPSVSVGTFGGEVKVIDYVSSKPGEFRILIVPDTTDEAWPKQVRIGSGTKGWVMLDDVPLWYEFWRQLNGFPPSLYQAPSNQNQPVKAAK